MSQCFAKSRQAFTGSTTSAKNPRFLAINHDIVPCTVEGLRRNGKPMAVRFTIIRPVCEGFANAPFKLKEQKRDPESRPLSQLRFFRTETGASQPVMGMWSYHKSGVYDKVSVAFIVALSTVLLSPLSQGPRSEVTWTLRAGNTLNLWLDEERMKQETKGEPMLPEGVLQIPAFSVCEISIASKNHASAEGGSSIKIATVRTASFSLHSLTSDLQFLSSSLGGARESELRFREDSPCLAKDLDVKDIPFWMPVSRTAILDDSAETVKLLNFGDSSMPHVEIPSEVLLNYTNCSRQDWSISMLDMAIAAGALSILVFTNDFWKAGARAIPIIDSEALLAALPSHTGSEIESRTPVEVSVSLNMICIIHTDCNRRSRDAPSSSRSSSLAKLRPCRPGSPLPAMISFLLASLPSFTRHMPLPSTFSTMTV